MGAALFGYGSLINTASRRLETGSDAGVAVWVEGLRRAWIKPVDAGGATALGAVEDPDHRCNGILFPVDADALTAIDRREGPFGYRRAEIDPARVRTLAQQPVAAAPVWIYLVRQPRPPTERCPIIQSYLDVVLGGCFEIGEAFAEAMVRTTTGWEGVWIDDRGAPRYPRAQPDADNERRVDELLARMFPTR